ncbi:hypothetical protein Q3052_002901 [Vibrio parahaemolyticus]|nr:hypothetical protein [Vibrio parahaemolyticus]ELA8194137.1 hypothetical protein [Vibrio parahaemolyticus]
MLILKKNGIEINLSQREIKLISALYNQEEMNDEDSNSVEALLRGYYNDKANPSLHCPCMKLVIANQDRFCIKRQIKQIHTPNCCLKNRPESNYKPKKSRPKPKGNIINLMAGAQTREPGQKPAGDTNKPREREPGRTGERRISTLVAAMYRLLDQAKCHILSANNRTCQETKIAIQTAAKDFYINDGISLSDILSIGEPNFKELTRRLQAQPDNWPIEERWHQIVLTPCDKFERNPVNDELVLHNKSRKCRIFNYSKVRINYAGNLSNKKDGPFLVMQVYTLGQSKTKGKFFPKLQKCAAIYIHKHSTWCPLESAYERHMLWGLEKVLATSGESYCIEKPIFDDNFGVRPDFIVSKTNDTKIAIEVAGYDSDEYRQSKTKTHPVMKKNYHCLLEFDAYNHKSEYKSAITWLKSKNIIDLL